MEGSFAGELGPAAILTDGPGGGSILPLVEALVRVRISEDGWSKAGPREMRRIAVVVANPNVEDSASGFVKEIAAAESIGVHVPLAASRLAAKLSSEVQTNSPGSNSNSNAKSVDNLTRAADAHVHPWAALHQETPEWDGLTSGAVVVSLPPSAVMRGKWGHNPNVVATGNIPDPNGLNAGSGVASVRSVSPPQGEWGGGGGSEADADADADAEAGGELRTSHIHGLPDRDRGGDLLPHTLFRGPRDQKGRFKAPLDTTVASVGSSIT